MMATILFSPEAEEDLRELVEYLAGRNPAAAAKLGQGILHNRQARRRRFRRP